jgi:peptidoglycan hydrolase-like protein with peptidoglycan-binding domain
MGDEEMKRTTAGAAVGVMLLSGVGLGVATAAPAAAYAGYCNDGYATVERKLDGGWYKTYVPGYNSNIDCTMGSGANSRSVEALQSSLNACYGSRLGFRLKTDGVFGTNTKNALGAAQHDEGITADGIYGKYSRAYLKWAFTQNSALRCVRI